MSVSTVRKSRIVKVDWLRVVLCLVFLPLWLPALVVGLFVGACVAMYKSGYREGRSWS